MKPSTRCKSARRRLATAGVVAVSTARTSNPPASWVRYRHHAACGKRWGHVGVGLTRAFKPAFRASKYVRGTCSGSVTMATRGGVRFEPLRRLLRPVPSWAEVSPGNSWTTAAKDSAVSFPSGTARTRRASTGMPGALGPGWAPACGNACVRYARETSASVNLSPGSLPPTVIIKADGWRAARMRA